MRKRLRDLRDQRRVFRATFDRLGLKNGYRGRALQTVLLRDVRDEKGVHLTDHIWLNFTKGFQAAELTPGAEIEFDARVKKYRRGYRGHREDVFAQVSFATSSVIRHGSRRWHPEHNDE